MMPLVAATSFALGTLFALALARAAAKPRPKPESDRCWKETL